MPATNNLSPSIQPYADNGTNYQSNNPDFIQRDENGNIIIDQGDGNNQNLVLETVSLNYFNSSVVNNIDTRFKYFKFPAENISIPDISFEGFGIDDLVDLVYAKYRPSEDRDINATTEYSGILMDTVVEGLPQQYRNRYEVTSAAKAEATAGLRMRIRLRHSYTETGIDLGNSRREIDDNGVALTFIEDYSNLRPEVRSELLAAAFDSDDYDNGEEWWGSLYGVALIWFNQLILQGEPRDLARTTLLDGLSSLITNVAAEVDSVIEVWDAIRIEQNNINKGTIYFSILKRTTSGDIIRNFQELTVNAGQSTAFIDANTTKVSEYDIIIPPDSFAAGELFGIAAIVGQRPGTEQPLRFVRTQHTILSAGTQWSITDASENVDENNVEIETA